jgi:hypothetical protein
MTIRFIVQVLIVAAVLYDACAAAFGWTTISASIRAIDLATGTLLRWAIVALWLHWFCPQWFVSN